MAPRDPPRRRIALLVNPAADGGRAARLIAPVATRLRAAGHPVRTVVGRDAAEALERATAAVAAGVEALVVLGGDGAVNLAVQAVAGTEVPLGIIPAGTGNDLAGHLGLPLRAPLSAADVVTRGHVRRIDAVRTGSGRWWDCALAAGFDSAVNDLANRLRWPRGRRRYDLAVLAELPTFRPIRFALRLDGQPEETTAMLVALGNARSYGAGLRIAPHARLDDGLLDVVVVGPVPAATLIRLYPTVWRGRHVDHPAVTVRRAAVVELSAPGVTAYADGERLGPLPLVNRCVPGALRVLAPLRT